MRAKVVIDVGLRDRLVGAELLVAQVAEGMSSYPSLKGPAESA